MSLPPNIRQLFGGMRGLPPGVADTEVNLPDTSEQVIISSLALLKMLQHGRVGVPMEVMGLMLGEFIDDYTIRVVDVFSMPQSGNTVSVEAVDPVYQAEMLEMLKRTGRPEMVVGWYHSHPGFGCWFSGTDINTQQSFEQLNSRAVGVVVDPIQSVKGKVVIDCFRLINTQSIMMGQEPRQTTSNCGNLVKPTITALIHGLNRHYYSLVISYKKAELEQNMLLSLQQKNWTDTLKIESFDTYTSSVCDLMGNIKRFSAKYKDDVEDECKLTKTELAVSRAGKLNAKKQLENCADQLVNKAVLQGLASSLAYAVF